MRLRNTRPPGRCQLPNIQFSMPVHHLHATQHGERVLCGLQGEAVPHVEGPDLAAQLGQQLSVCSAVLCTLALGAGAAGLARCGAGSQPAAGPAPRLLQICCDTSSPHTACLCMLASTLSPSGAYLKEVVPALWSVVLNMMAGVCSAVYAPAHSVGQFPTLLQVQVCRSRCKLLLGQNINEQIWNVV